MKKNKPTIFGEESFMIPNMVEQLYHKEMEFRDDVLFGRIACDFNLDKEKVKRQLELCNKLENIDKTDLIDMATKKKLLDKDYEIKVLQKALELACDLIKSIAIVAQSYSLEEPNCNVKDVEYFKQQAKEMMENE